jgi:hypothetical protein
LHPLADGPFGPEVVLGLDGGEVGDDGFGRFEGVSGEVLVGEALLWHGLIVHEKNYIEFASDVSFLYPPLIY